MGIISKQHLINEEIQSEVVKLVSDEGVIEGMSLGQALSKADGEGLDLVEMSVVKGESVCKLMNYSKFLYDQKKKSKQNLSKKEVLKEIKFGNQIADHDLQIRAKKALNILEEGDKVKVNVIYKGREVSRINTGKTILEKFLGYLPETVIVLKQPKVEGNTYTMELKIK